MYYEEQEQAVSFLTGLVLGAVIGAGVALLSAPNTGRRTRRKIARAAHDARDTAQERFDHLTDDVRDRMDGAVQLARKRIGR